MSLTIRRVVMVAPHFPPGYGGAGQQAARLITGLVRNGCHVQVLCRAPEDRAAPRTETLDGCTVTRFRPPGRGRLGWMAFGRWIARQLDRIPEWELLHIHGFGPFCLLPLRTARRYRRPVVVKTTLLGGDDPATISRGILGPALIRSFRRVEAVVALSAELEQAFRDDGRFSGQVVRIPNGVDTAVFRPAESAERAARRAALRIPPQDKVLLTAGALVRRKRVDLLLRAAAAMRARPLTVLHAGPANFDRSHDAELLASTDAAPRNLGVRFLGPVSGPRLAAAMHSADLFVLPSAAEGLPNTVLEALACRLPAVTYDIPGCRDVLEDGGGFLVSPETPLALARALDDLLNSPDRRRRLGLEGLELVRSRYDLDTVATRYRDLYDGLCRRQEPA